jgi:ketosteroid isomerase-like protein
MSNPDEVVTRNLALVQAHFDFENPNQIHEAIDLYTDDIVWEAPARGVSYKGKEMVERMYRAIFDAAPDLKITPIARFATEDRVVDDCWAKFSIAGPGFEQCPFPVGTKVDMRLVHIFEIRGDRISKETGFEIWRQAEV